MGIFGEKHEHGLYLPMSEEESETLLRLWEEREYSLFDKDLGELLITNVIVGDKRIGIQFRIGPTQFEGYEVARPLPYFHLSLHAKGRRLFTKEMSTQYNGGWLMVHKGFFADLQLDIAIDKINPDLIREVKEVKGLTSRRGNENLTPFQTEMKHLLDEGYKKVERIQQENLQKAKNESTK